MVDTNEIYKSLVKNREQFLRQCSAINETFKAYHGFVASQNILFKTIETNPSLDYTQIENDINSVIQETNQLSSAIAFKKNMLSDNLHMFKGIHVKTNAEIDVLRKNRESKIGDKKTKTEYRSQLILDNEWILKAKSEISKNALFEKLFKLTIKIATKEDCSLKDIPKYLNKQFMSQALQTSICKHTSSEYSRLNIEFMEIKAEKNNTNSLYNKREQFKPYFEPLFSLAKCLLEEILIEIDVKNIEISINNKSNEVSKAESRISFMQSSGPYDLIISTLQFENEGYQSLLEFLKPAVPIIKERHILFDTGFVTDKKLLYVESSSCLQSLAANSTNKEIIVEAKEKTKDQRCCIVY